MPQRQAPQHQYDDCLRPGYTERVIRKLSEGFSMNVYAEAGQGKTRLLDDIARIAQNDKTVCLLRVDLKKCADSYTGFFKSLKPQLPEPLPREANPSMAIPFEALLDHQLRSKAMEDKMIWLCLDNFDALFGAKTDKNYNRPFIDYLNSLRNERNVGVLLLSQKAIAAGALYIDNKILKGSKIDAQRDKMPNLFYPQIEKELERKYNDEVLRHFAENLNQWKFLQKEIEKYSYPYTFLNDLCTQMNTRFSNSPNLKEFKKQLAILEKELVKEYKSSLDNTMGSVQEGVKMWKKRTTVALGISEDVNWLKNKWTWIASGLIAFGITLYNYWEWIATFLGY